jgi:hypothetical protein
MKRFWQFYRRPRSASGQRAEPGHPFGAGQHAARSQLSRRHAGAPADYGLPDMTKILQGMPGTAHELMGTLSAVLLKYEPRLKK